MLTNYIAAFGLGIVVGIMALFWIAYRYFDEPEPKEKTVVLRANHERELMLQLKRSTNRLQDVAQKKTLKHDYDPTLVKLVNDNRKLLATCKRK